MDPRTAIPDAVVAALNAAVAGAVFPAGVSFTAARAWLPEFKIEQYAALTVIVALSSFEKEAITKRDLKWTVVVDVAVVQHVPDKTNAILDPLSATVNTIASESVLEKRLPLAGGRGAEWIETANSPHFDRDRLSSKNLFFSLSQFTYLAVLPR
jgi:hypothetical protein